MNKEKSQIMKRLYTLKDAAAYLGRPVSSIRTLVWKGALPVIQDGRKMYVDVNDLELYINRSKTTMI
jgi:excisionase family DNA binding protein